MKMSHPALVVFMIGHLLSLLHAHVESTLRGEEYLENETVLSNSSQCRGRLSEDSELGLKRLIFEEKKQLIYLQLNSTLFNITKANVTEIMFPSKWVWVTNDAGRPLLELDLRYDVYSLTTLSLDVGDMMIDIEIQNKDNGMDYHELLSLVRCSIHEATKQETSPHYSVCHSRLFERNYTLHIEWSALYLQYICCDMTLHNFNFQESQLSNHTCQVFANDTESTLFYAVFWLLYIFSPLLVRLLHFSEDNWTVTQNDGGSDDGEEDSMMSRNHDAQTNIPMLYVNFDSSAPLCITGAIRYILQLRSQNTWIRRIRQLAFFVFVFPCVIYIMAAVDAAKYPELQMLSDVEIELDIDVAQIMIFDRLWLWRWNGIFAMHAALYGIMTIWLSTTTIFENVLNNSANSRMGFMDLPHHLCRQHESKHGFVLLYDTMIHRFSLFWELKFWKFWIKEVVHTFTGPCCEHQSFKGICLSILGRLRRLILYVYSLLWILPLFNFVLLTDTKDPRQFFQICLILGSVVFIPSCGVLSIVILYTTKGIVKHYTQTLPLVSIIVVILYYIVGTIHRLKEKYKKMKQVIFDECISLQKDIDDGNIQGIANFRLVVDRPDGIPMIPKVIYDQTIEKHLPLRDSEFFALIKLVLIVFVVIAVGNTVDVFNMTNAMTLGQTIAAFFIITLPKLFDIFYGQDQIESESLKFKVRQTIKNGLVQDTADAPNRDAANVATECELPSRHMETIV